MVWSESALSRLVTTVEVLGDSVSAVSIEHDPAGRGSGGCGGSGRVIVVNDDQVAGRDAVAGFQLQLALERDIVDLRAVLAAEILHGPVLAIALERHVLARETGIVGKAQFRRAGPAQSHTVAGQLVGFVLAVGTLDKNLSGHKIANR